MSFLDLAKERYSCREFTGQPVEDEKIKEIVEAGLAAPTAANLQPYRIWVIRGEENAAKIAETTKFTFGAKDFILVGAAPEEAWVRPFDKANFCDVDASIVATHIMLAIEDAGLGTTWVGFFDSPKFAELFPETKGYHLDALFPIGYKKGGPAPKHTQRNPEVVKYL